MSYQDNLDADYKGVPFFVDSESLPKFGRNLAISIYPNTSEQFAEDTGGFPEEFDVEGFVIGTDAKQKFEALKNACNEKGSGALTLPFFGTHDMLAGEGSVSVRPNQDVEKICFSIKFHSSRAEAGFVAAAETPMMTYAIGEEARGGFADSLGGLFDINGGDFLGNLVAITDLSNILGSVGKFKSFIASSEWGKILSKIDLIAGNIAQLITTGKFLAGQFSGKNGLYGLLSTALMGKGTAALIEALTNDCDRFESTLPTSIKSIHAAASPAYEFVVKPVNYWTETTQIRIDRNENRRLIADFHRFNMLAIAYEQFSDATFNTANEAAAAKSKIEQSYIKVLHGIEGIKSGVRLIDGEVVRSRFAVSDAALSGLEKVRLTSLAASRGGLVVRYKVEQQRIDIYGGTSILNLAYLSEAERLTDENELVDFARTLRQANGRRTYGISGDVTVLRRAS
jgi:hypothetical protein